MCIEYSHIKVLIPIKGHAATKYDVKNCVTKMHSDMTHETKIVKDVMMKTNEKVPLCILKVVRVWKRVIKAKETKNSQWMVCDTLKKLKVCDSQSSTHEKEPNIFTSYSKG